MLKLQGRVLLAIAVLAATVSSAAPQVSRSAITVVVVDSSGRPVPNAQVRMSGEPKQGLLPGKLDEATQFSGLTDERGKFITQVLSYEGVYSLTVRCSGYTTQTTMLSAPLPPEVTLRLAPEAQRPNTAVQGGLYQVPGQSGGQPAADQQEQAPGNNLNQPTPGEQPNAPESTGITWKAVRPVLVAFLPLFAQYIGPLLAYFVIRAITVRLMLYYMMQRAPKRTTEPARSVTFLEEEAPVGAGGRPEVDFLNLNTTNGVLLNGSAQDRLERTEETGKRTLYAFQWSVLAAAAECLVILTLRVLLNPLAAGLLATAALILYIASLMIGWYRHWAMKVLVLTGLVVCLVALAVKASRSPADLTAAGIAPAALIVWLAYSLVIAWQFYFTQKRLMFGVAVFLVLLTTGVGIAVSVIVGLAVSVMKVAPFYLALLPAIVQGFTVWYLMAQIRQTTMADGNRRLLILRVFGSDKNAAFTFGRLMAKWQFVGSFLTIVDPSYIRYQFSLRRLRTSFSAGLWYFMATILALGIGKLLIFFFPGLMPAAFNAMPAEQKTQYMSGVGYVILTPIAILPLFLYVKSRFVKSPDDAEQRITKAVEKGKPLRLGGVFGGCPLWCFDDVWKPAVRKMLPNSDVVLMDLRGFTPERAGCAYEIAELVDHFPIERVLLVVSADVNKHALYNLIRERWWQMSASSPNRNTPNAVIKVYGTNPRAKARQARRDITWILALLSACVDEKAAAGQQPAKRLVRFARSAAIGAG